MFTSTTSPPGGMFNITFPITFSDIRHLNLRQMTGFSLNGFMWDFRFMYLFEINIYANNVYIVQGLAKQKVCTVNIFPLFYLVSQLRFCSITISQITIAT